ncbi:sialic acid binding Ig-like lectin 15, like [Chanodichthys erythropterus]|uniref:sialic acid binding Ig-like lectin 15, like n=1 Tax=Chanodichthys erythropterus TaxID=933992 RepID=UPI00351E255A
MRDFVFGFLTFICSLKGLTCSDWTMPVQPKVNGSLGQNVILPCAFTHPRQNTYTGVIHVKWIKESKKEPIFHCTLDNRTNSQDSCTNLKPSERLSLNGNPRKGDLSLRISNLEFTDAAHYTCRVELDYIKFGNHSDLNINAQAKILSLSLDVDAKAHVVTLKCIAQGNPVPEVKWTSSYGLLANDSIRTDLRNYLSSATSSFPFSDQDVHTCQAVNSLGQDQITFPPDHPNCSFGLLVVTCFLGCLLFLGLVAFVLVVIKRKKKGQSVQGVKQQQPHIGEQKVETFQANETVYANVSPCPVGCETRQDEGYSKGVPLEERKVGLIPGAQTHKNPLRGPIQPHVPPPPPPTSPPPNQ